MDDSGLTWRLGRVLMSMTSTGGRYRRSIGAPAEVAVLERVRERFVNQKKDQFNGYWKEKKGDSRFAGE